jgi:hypothetical protein
MVFVSSTVKHFHPVRQAQRIRRATQSVITLVPHPHGKHVETTTVLVLPSRFEYDSDAHYYAACVKARIAANPDVVKSGCSSACSYVGVSAVE